VSEGDDATLPDPRQAQLGTDPVPRVSATDLGDRYEVGPMLGRGGMGEVRLARDLRIDREVAVKLMRSQLRDEQTLGRFFREARVQGVLEHPAVVPVHDLGIDPDGNPYFVMKRLAGTTLHDVIAKGDPGDRDDRGLPGSAHPWPRRTLLARMIDICLAIDFAHTRGVIHRDLKPANIMLGDFGEAYVLDWGLARIADESDSFRGVGPLSGDGAGHTVAGELLGTPGYMSPEQARGEAVTAATDVFALGAVLYEVLAGVPALPRGPAAIALTLSSSRHRPSAVMPDVPPELDDLCADATDADPAKRPTARALADRLQAYLDGDRDQARRKELADAAVSAATTALATGTDDSRATAMREAGRALALDPAHTAAQELLAALLFELPESLPAEAVAAADLDRSAVRQHMMRRAGIGYLMTIPILLGMLALPLHHTWPLFFGAACGAAIGALSLYLSRRVLPMRSPWLVTILGLNCLMITTSGLLFGALLILPMFIVGSLSAFVSQPSHHSRWLITGFHLAPLIALLGLEHAGVLPPSFAVEGGALLITPYTVDLSPLTLVIVFAVAFFVQIASTFDIQSAFRAAQEDAQNKVHAQRWHLGQVFPLKKR